MFRSFGASTWSWVGWLSIFVGISSAVNLIVHIGELSLIGFTESFLAFYQSITRPLHLLFAGPAWPFGYDPMLIDLAITYSVLVGISLRDERAMIMVDNIGEPLTQEECSNFLERSGIMKDTPASGTLYIAMSGGKIAHRSATILRAIFRALGLVALSYILISGLWGFFEIAQSSQSDWFLFRWRLGLVEKIHTFFSGGLSLPLSLRNAGTITIVSAGIVMMVCYSIEFGPPKTGSVNWVEVLSISPVVNLRPVAARVRFGGWLRSQLKEVDEFLAGDTSGVDQRLLKQIRADRDEGVAAVNIHKVAFYQFISFPLGVVT